MSQTNPLDRLSALLAGLAPCCEIVPAPQGDAQLPASPEPVLYLHLLLDGRWQWQAGERGWHSLIGPAILLCPASLTHQLQQQSGALFCLRVRLDGPAAPLLLAQFPQAQALALHTVEPGLQQVLQLIAAELAGPRCGGQALLAHAGQILFIALLRHLVQYPAADNRLFHALADPAIARALVAMHGAPQQDWSLERLADTAGLSRTGFAVRFRERLAMTPGKYLGQLRLSIARRHVERGEGLKRAAQAAGFASTAALSRALGRQASH